MWCLNMEIFNLYITKILLDVHISTFATPIYISISDLFFFITFYNANGKLTAEIQRNKLIY